MVFQESTTLQLFLQIFQWALAVRRWGQRVCGACVMGSVVHGLCACNKY